jgi:hypothetical protein
MKDERTEICEWCEREAPAVGHCCLTMDVDLSCRRHLGWYCYGGGATFSAIISKLQGSPVKRPEGPLWVTTVEDLTKCTARDLLMIKGFGRKSLYAIRNWLAAGGLALASEPTERHSEE